MWYNPRFDSQDIFMKIAFISDLHLSARSFDNNQLFYALLTKWQDELDALYILGDMFDYWLGDDDQNTFIQEVESTLKRFAQAKPIYFIGGNHDFGIGQSFAHRTGIQILQDCAIITVGDRRILLSHGDVFCTLDIKYQRMKKILQHPLMIAMLRKVPLAWRIKLKDKLEHESVRAFNTEPAATYYVVDDAVSAAAAEHGADVVIHGHTHHPGRYVIAGATGSVTRFEIPDWVERTAGGYVLLDDNKITIHIPETEVR